MKRTRRSRTPLNPFFAWGDLAMQTVEMFSASAQVIQQRTSRNNSPAQLFEMVNEKVQAGVESAHAMTRYWIGMQGRTPIDPLMQWAGLFTSAVTPFHARALRNAHRTSRR